MDGMLTKNDLDQIKNIVDGAVETKVKDIVDGSINEKVKNIVDHSIETKVKNIVDTSIREAFDDFHTNLFEPHVTQSVQQHQEIVREIVFLKHEVKGLKNETGEIKEYIKDHDQRISHLEKVVLTKN